MGEVTAPEALDPSHDLAGFDCGKRALTDWLRHRALKNEARGSRTFVVCRARRVLGYYALAAGAVVRDRAPAGISRNMPDPVPVIVLARLAVDRTMQGQRIGEGLLKDALKRALAASREIGARAVLVHALDGDAANFYLQYGFRLFPADARTLYLAMEHIAAAI
ncbi:MAG TPA: GNAT family N-acetyltransferase [Rhizomicrobium sp.]|nr:GNAT family N-acetyltransferase [Rhizomicrobium sp.]